MGNISEEVNWPPVKICRPCQHRTKQQQQKLCGEPSLKGRIHVTSRNDDCNMMTCLREMQGSSRCRIRSRVCAAMIETLRTLVGGFMSAYHKKKQLKRCKQGQVSIEVNRLFGVYGAYYIDESLQQEKSGEAPLFVSMSWDESGTNRFGNR